MLIGERVARSLARLISRVFFSRLEVVGAHNIPAEGPFILVANHVNSLVDPILLLAIVPRPVRFLAAHTLWKDPFVRPFLNLARVIPVFRPKDPGADPVRNLETFAKCREVLAAGGAIAIFPEGRSHDEPHVLPLKTGTARIALETVAQHPGTAVRIVPAGLIFTAKRVFRSQALLVVGEPLDPALESAFFAAEPREAVHRLTDRISEALAAVTMNARTWDEVRLIKRVAGIFGSAGQDLPYPPPLAESFEAWTAFARGRGPVEEAMPREVAETTAAVRGYDLLLEAFGLRDGQVAARYPLSQVAAYTARILLKLVVLLPFAAAGTVLNWVPYRLAGLIQGRLSGTPDQDASYKVFASVFLFPAFWLAEAVAALLLAGRWAAAATFAAAPLLGVAAMFFQENVGDFVTEARAYLFLRTSGKVAEEMKERRAGIARRVEELVKYYRSRMGE